MKTWANAELQELSLDQTQFDFESLFPEHGETLSFNSVHHTVITLPINGRECTYIDGKLVVIIDDGKNLCPSRLY